MCTCPQNASLSDPDTPSPMDSLKGTCQNTLQQRTSECTFYEKVLGPKIKTKYRHIKTQEKRLSASQNHSQTSLKKKQVIRQNSFAKHCDIVRKTACSLLSLSALTASVLAWQRLCVYTVNIKITYNGYISPSICQRSLRIEHFASVPPLIHRRANLLTVTQHQEVWILLIEGCRTRFVRTWWLLAQGWVAMAAMNFFKFWVQDAQERDASNKMAVTIVGQHSTLRT